MRRDCQPHFADAEGNLVNLRRVDFGDRAIGERFLQQQLDRSPFFLPIAEIDDSFAPLVSLGREIDSIDNLFISPSGRITIVETKLWRNPEATRQVVAQILEYAKRLSSLTYEQFEQKCRLALQPAPLAETDLYGLVSKQFPNVMSEADFIDAVRRNLQTTRFMLLVVGDGIRENLEDMLGLLRDQPQMHFTFGLVEMQIYESDVMPGRLIVPHLVARTKEIVRAVVRVENRAEVDVSVSLPPTEEPGSIISVQEFLDSIKEPRTRDVFAKLIDFANEFGYVRRTPRSIAAAMEYKGTGELRFFRLGLQKQGRVRVLPLDQQLRKRGVDVQVAIDTATRLAEIFPQVGLKFDKPELARQLKPIEVEAKLEEFKDVFRRAVARITALEPTVLPSSEDNELEEDDEDVNSEL